jgi:hypothetical protein
MPKAATWLKAAVPEATFRKCSIKPAGKENKMAEKKGKSESQST